jgi:hypothetical protein
MTASIRRLATAAALTLTMVILSGGAAGATEVGCSGHIGRASVARGSFLSMGGVGVPAYF